MIPNIRLQMAQARGGSWCGKAALLGHKIPLMPLQADIARALKTPAAGRRNAQKSKMMNKRNCHKCEKRCVT